MVGERNAHTTTTSIIPDYSIINFWDYNCFFTIIIVASISDSTISHHSIHSYLVSLSGCHFSDVQIREQSSRSLMNSPETFLLLILLLVFPVHPLPVSHSASLNPHTQHIPRGVGLQYPRVLWYHFPKTGGTSMRYLLHGFCQQTHLNMTSYYGLLDECNGTPFACNTGEFTVWLSRPIRVPGANKSFVTITIFRCTSLFHIRPCAG